MLSKWARSNLNSKHIITIIAAVIFIVASMFLFTSQVPSLNSYLSFLNTREYNYSVIVDKDIEEDSYAYYDKKIIFFNYGSLAEGINAIVLMETNNTHSNKDFLKGYDVSSLKKNEVAVSSNIANNYKLSTGSIIYSKSKVKNIVESYTISIILPEICGISEDDISNLKGIIIMGCDEEILLNIQTNYLYFYYEDYSLINSKGANISGQLYSIETLKSNINKKHMMYSLITALMICAISIICFSLLSTFNINVYKKKREYGDISTYSQMRLDYLIYYLAVLVLTNIGYLIGSIWLGLAIEFFIELFSILTISTFVIYFIYVKKIRRL